MSSLRQNLARILAIGFLVYGFARVFGATMVLMGQIGLLDKPEVTAAVELLRNNSAALNAKAFIPLNVEQYLLYSIFMGVVLLISAAAALARKGWGVWGVLAYNVLFAAMFLNFQEANAKLIHLGAGSVLAVLLLVLTAADRRRPAVG